MERTHPIHWKGPKVSGWRKRQRRPPWMSVWGSRPTPSNTRIGARQEPKSPGMLVTVVTQALTRCTCSSTQTNRKAQRGQTLDICAVVEKAIVIGSKHLMALSVQSQLLHKQRSHHSRHPSIASQWHRRGTKRATSCRRCYQVSMMSLSLSSARTSSQWIWKTYHRGTPSRRHTGGIHLL